MPGWIQAESDFFEGERSMGDRKPNFGRQHEIEAARPRVPVYRAYQRLSQIEIHECCGGDAAEPGEGLVVEALAACQPLRRRNGRVHVHPGTEHLIAPSRQHGAPNLGVLGDLAPRGGQLTQRRRVQSIGTVGPVDGDEGDVGVCAGVFEASCHSERSLTPGSLGARVREAYGYDGYGAEASDAPEPTWASRATVLGA